MFKLRQSVALAFLLLWLASTQSLAAQTDLSGNEIFRKLSSSVVLLVTEAGLGSGVFLSEDIIATNWHVMGNEKLALVCFKSPNDTNMDQSHALIVGYVVQTDYNSDLAFLKVNKKPRHVVPVPLGMDEEIAIGTEVHAIGHPTGQIWTYTKGVISQVRNHFTWKTHQGAHRANVIQTQTPINMGNSGGPLLSNKGHLLGINAFKDASGEGLSFAVSVSELRKFDVGAMSRYSQKLTGEYFDDLVTTPEFDREMTQYAKNIFRQEKQAPGQKTKAKNRDVEVAIFLETMMSNNAPKLPEWTFHNRDSLIDWKGKFRKIEDNKRERIGHVWLSANGESYYKVERDVIKLPWVVAVNGDIGDEGIAQLNLYPHSDAGGDGNSGVTIAFPSLIERNPSLSLSYVCSRERADAQEDFYILKALSGKANVLSFYSSHASGGLTDTINLHYDLAPNARSIRSNVSDCVKARPLSHRFGYN